MQDVIQTLERLEKGQKNCRMGMNDDADFQSLQSPHEGPEAAADLGSESTRQQASVSLQAP